MEREQDVKDVNSFSQCINARRDFIKNWIKNFLNEIFSGGQILSNYIDF